MARGRSHWISGTFSIVKPGQRNGCYGVDEGARLAAGIRRYPLRLISRRMMTAYNSSARDLPALRAKWVYNPAFMNPAELERLDLARAT